MAEVQAIHEGRGPHDICDSDLVVLVGLVRGCYDGKHLVVELSQSAALVVVSIDDVAAVLGPATVAADGGFVLRAHVQPHKED